MATVETQILDGVIASSRRKLLAKSGAILAGLAFSSATQAQTTTTPAALTDTDYLNFALNLEYLEANFYTLAATGQTIDQLGISLTGVGIPAVAATGTTAAIPAVPATPGKVITKAGGPASCMVPFTNTLVQSYATELATEERNHVSFLRSALGSSAVAQPSIDLYNSFNYLVTLLPLGLGSFDPFANDINFLLGSYLFEDVGVSAYTGAAPLLSSLTFLDAAAGIQGVEAYHAGIIRTTIFGLDQSAATLPSGSLYPPGTAIAAAAAISKLRASVDGSASVSGTRPDGDDIGLGTQQVSLNGSTSYTATSLVDASTTGSLNPAGAGGTAGSLVFARSGAEVLAIVYAGGTKASNKGFFPAGLNGNIA